MTLRDGRYLTTQTWVELDSSWLIPDTNTHRVSEYNINAPPSTNILFSIALHIGNALPTIAIAIVVAISCSFYSDCPT